GVLILVSAGDRRARIEVGYGLEGAIPDAIAKRILEDVMFPFFRRGDWAGGLSAGVDAVLRAAAGEPLPAPTRRGRPGPGGGDPLVLIAFPAMLGMFAGLPFRRGRLRPVSALVGGGVAGFLAWRLLESLVWGAAGCAAGGVLAWRGRSGE